MVSKTRWPSDWRECGPFVEAAKAHDLLGDSVEVDALLYERAYELWQAGYELGRGEQNGVNDRPEPVEEHDGWKVGDRCMTPGGYRGHVGHFRPIDTSWGRTWYAYVNCDSGRHVMPAVCELVEEDGRARVREVRTTESSGNGEPSPELLEKARRLQALAMDSNAAPQERENAWNAFSEIWKKHPNLPPDFGL